MAVKTKKNDVNPLNWQVPIVNKDGTPTNEFMRKWEQQANANASIPDVTSAAAVSAVLDLLGLAQGDILYRDVDLWKVLTPGTLGYVLQTGGAAANPSWAAASTVLDRIGSTQGEILYRNGTVWTVLAAGTDGQLLTYSASTHAPFWDSFSGVLLGVGAPTALEPAGTLYSQTDAAGVWSSQPTYIANPTVVQFASTSGAAAIGSVTLPGAPTVGNLLIALLGTGTDPSAHLAAGWTSFENGSGGGTLRYGRALYRYVQVGDTAVLPAIGSGGTFFWFAEVYEISHVSGVFANDVVAHPAIYGQTASPLTTPAATTAAPEQLVLLGGGTYDASTNMTNPATWTSDILTNNNSNYGAWLASNKLVAVAGTSIQASIAFPTGTLLVAFAIQVVIANTSALVANWTLVGPSPLASSSVFGLAKVDNATITAVGGVISTIMSTWPVLSADLNGVSQATTGPPSTALISLSHVSIDTAGWFNTTTHRYVPQRAGNYLFMGYGQIILSAVSVNDGPEALVFKNGALAIAGSYAQDNGTGSGSLCMGIIPMNGTTDYVELRIYSPANGTFYRGDPSQTFLKGVFIPALLPGA